MTCKLGCVVVYHIGQDNYIISGINDVYLLMFVLEKCTLSVYTIYNIMLSKSVLTLKTSSEITVRKNFVGVAIHSCIHEELMLMYIIFLASYI